MTLLLGGRNSAPPIYPLIPADPYFRYHARDALATYATVTTAAGGVRDSSGHGRPNAAALAVSARPVVNTGGAGGNQYLTFDGTDRMPGSGTVLDFLNGKPGGTICAVARCTTVLGTGRTLIAFSIGTGTSNRMAITVTTQGKWEVAGRATDTDAILYSNGATALDGQVHFVVAVNDPVGGVQRIYVDDDLVAERTNFYTSGSTTATRSQASNYGSSAVPNLYWLGDSYEVIAYDRALAPAEVAAFTSYVTARYGLQPVRYAPVTLTAQSTLTVADAAAAQVAGAVDLSASATLTAGAAATPAVSGAVALNAQATLVAGATATTPAAAAGITFVGQIGRAHV